MVYAYDQWAQMPVKDLYDTQMMLASVNAAKDMYEKAAKEIDDFREKYGDFYSPIKSQQDWYNQEFNAADKINEIYARGGDPLRNAADRTELMRWINSRQYGKLGEAKRNAENVQKYLEADAVLKSKGLSDDDFNRYVLQQINPESGGLIENWGDKPFNILSPYQYSTLRDMVHPTFSAIKPHLLNKEEVESRGYQYDPRNDYTGIVRADMERAMGEYIPGVRNDPRFQYHRYLAQQDLIREGNTNPTEQQIDQRLINNAITSDAGIMTPLEVDANKWKMAEFEHASRMAAASVSASNNSSTSPQYEGVYSHRDDLTERGLKNMYGLNPSQKLGNLPDGTPITMQRLADGNPEFFNKYANNVLLASAQNNGKGHPITKLLTHSTNIPEDYPTRMNANVKPLTKWGTGNTDVSNRNLYALHRSDISKLYTPDELEHNLYFTAGAFGRYVTKGGSHFTNSNGDSNFDWSKAAYEVVNSDKYGVVTGFVGNKIMHFVPVYLYQNNTLNNRQLVYMKLPYNSIESTGDIKTLREKGISTIYDPKEDTFGQIRSASVDKSAGIGSTELKTVSIDSPWGN